MAHEGTLSECRDEQDHDVENGNDADCGDGNQLLNCINIIIII